jgi:hypothetical protein
VDAPNLRLVKLTDESLAELAEGTTELADQVRRRRALAFNDAFAVYCGESIAHIAWLVSAEHQKESKNANVQLRAGEAEITHCYTVPEFRGQGVYVYSIRKLCSVAKRSGVSRVFMITNISNTASRRGIEKAGLRPSGVITRVSVPWVSSKVSAAVRKYTRN